MAYGNTSYHLTVALSGLVNPIACFIAFYTNASSMKTIQPVLTFFGSISAIYIVYTAVASPTPPLHDSTTGKVLIILIWMIFKGFFSYSRACIASLLRNTSTGHKFLFFSGIFTQIGSTIGAVFIFVLIEYTNIFIPYFPCS